MKTANKSYIGIDLFRVIAAILIIAIHTSPFGSYNTWADFVLTRVIARVAVPFFFMTSGFFLISRYQYSTKKLGVFVKKTAWIYGAAIVLYIPINLYNGYFQAENLLPNIVKDIVFDGTMYHLWYLPASLSGGVFVWYLVRRLEYDRAFAVAAVLYFIGLFGDSYYGLIENNTVLNGFYTLLFQVSDYTRNGIFFAPIFFLLGGWIADSGIHFSRIMAWVLFVSMMLFMLVEGLILHQFHLQRHDSMYFFWCHACIFCFKRYYIFEESVMSGCGISHF